MIEDIFALAVRFHIKRQGGDGLAILQHLLMPTFDSITELERGLGVPVLGAVSAVRTVAQRAADYRQLRWVALAVFIAAGVTDYLDGYYARMWDQQSAFGRMLDPIADSVHPVLRMPVGRSWIAAPTAAVLYQFRELCIAGRATRVAHFEQPLFARR